MKSMVTLRCLSTRHFKVPLGVVSRSNTFAISRGIVASGKALSLLSSPASFPTPPSVVSFSTSADPALASPSASAEPSNPTDVRKEILEGALAFVPEKGWSMDCIQQACLEKGISVASVGLFPRGAVELVDYVVTKHGEEMTAELLANQDRLEGLPVQAQLFICLRTYLEKLVPYIVQWPSALALRSQPANLTHSLQSATDLMDEVWHITGDRSSDAEWYSKRVGLGGVYTCAELYMLTDSSENFQDTWAFLERLLEDLSSVGQVPTEFAAKAGTATNLLRTVLQNAGAQMNPTEPPPQPVETATDTSTNTHINTNTHGEQIKPVILDLGTS